MGRPSFFGIIIGIGRSTPIVTICTHLGIHIKMVEQNEFLGKFVLIGGDIPAKQQQGAITIAARQICQYLVVGTIFFDDIKNVFDGRCVANTIRNGITYGYFQGAALSGSEGRIGIDLSSVFCQH